jgi:hypothetical protein
MHYLSDERCFFRAHFLPEDALRSIQGGNARVKLRVNKIGGAEKWLQAQELKLHSDAMNASRETTTRSRTRRIPQTVWSGASTAPSAESTPSMLRPSNSERMCENG